MISLLKPAPEIPRLPAQRVDAAYRRLRWQVFAGIFVGYAGYYFVRKNFALAMPDILRAVQNWLALSCCDAAVLSLTESFARQLAPYANSVKATEFRIMGNPFCSADILNRLNNHWWLTGGDTDYR